MTMIQPVLGSLSKAKIASAIGISKDYAYGIARGEKIPHRRHWLKLAELVSIHPGK
jgi:hypothetical protein